MTDEATLASLHLDVLYEGMRGRILQSRGESPSLTPHAHFFRTRVANHWLVSGELPVEAAETIAGLFAREPIAGDPADWERSEPACLQEVRTVLSEYVPLRGEYHGPAFTFPNDLPSDNRGAPVTTPVALRTDESLLWVRSLSRESVPVLVARDGDETIVAVCYSARRTTTAAEAGVETAPRARRRGLGAAVVTQWARAIQADGGVPLYSTSWENEASRALAVRLRLQLYGEDWHID